MPLLGCQVQTRGTLSILHTTTEQTLSNAQEQLRSSQMEQGIPKVSSPLPGGQRAGARASTKQGLGALHQRGATLQRRKGLCKAWGRHQPQTLAVMPPPPSPTAPSHSPPCVGEPKGSKYPLHRKSLHFTSEKSLSLKLKCSIPPGFLLGFASPRPYPSTWQQVQGCGVSLQRDQVPSLPTAICTDWR